MGGTSSKQPVARLPQGGLPPGCSVVRTPMGNVIACPDEAAAEYVDSLDGRRNGQHMGLPIAVLSGHAPQVAPYRATPVMAPPVFTAAPALHQPTLSLDAADGVIDGRYFGQHITSAPVSTYAPAPVATYAPAAVSTFAPVSIPQATSSTYAPAPVSTYAHAPVSNYAPAPVSSYAPAPVRTIASAPATYAPISTPVSLPAAHYTPTFAPMTMATPAAMSYTRMTTPPMPVTTYSTGGYNIPAQSPYRPKSYAFTAPTSMKSQFVTPAAMYGTTMMRPASVSNAYALDAADGRIDGRYFGASIARRPMIAMPTAYHPTAPVYGMTSHAYATPVSSAFAMDAADGVIDGRYYGAPVTGVASAYNMAAPAYAAPVSSAFALDAADGRIDGRYYGAPVTGVASAYNMAAPAYAAPVSSAFALDAADGRIDGRYYGAPVTGVASAYNMAAPAYAAPVSSAFALDAADGRIDGRYHGAPVLGAASMPYAPRTYAPVLY